MSLLIGLVCIPAVSIVGRTVFHSSWCIPPNQIAAEGLGLALSTARQPGQATIFASDPEEVMSGVQLIDGEIQMVWFHALLPPGLPPTLSGTAIKHTYAIMVKVQLHGEPPLTVQLPFRVTTATEQWRRIKSTISTEGNQSDGSHSWVDHGPSGSARAWVDYPTCAPCPVALCWERLKFQCAPQMPSKSVGMVALPTSEALLRSTRCWQPQVMSIDSCDDAPTSTASVLQARSVACSWETVFGLRTAAGTDNRLSRFAHEAANDQEFMDALLRVEATRLDQEDHDASLVDNSSPDEHSATFKARTFRITKGKSHILCLSLRPDDAMVGESMPISLDFRRTHSSESVVAGDSEVIASAVPVNMLPCYSVVLALHSEERLHPAISKAAAKSTFATEHDMLELATMHTAATTCTLHIPSDAPPSFESRFHAVCWTLRLTLSVGNDEEGVSELNWTLPLQVRPPQRYPEGCGSSTTRRIPTTRI